MKYNSGYYKQQYKYKSFYPALVNQNYKWDDPKINIKWPECKKRIINARDASYALIR